MNAVQPPFGVDQYGAGQYGAEQYFEWTAGGMIDPETAPEAQWAGLAGLAHLRLLDRIIEGESDRKRWDRMVQARRLFAQRLYETAVSANSADRFPPGFSTEPEGLRDRIHKRLPEALCLGMLVTAEMGSPFSPYSIRVPDRRYQHVVQEFARDLGVPARWAKQARKSVGAVTPGRGGWAAWAASVGGALFAVVAAPLAYAFDPGGAILGGSAAQLEARVKMMHANAHAKHTLREGSSIAEIPVLEAMLGGLEADLEVHDRIDDRGISVAVRELKQKIKAVEDALDALIKLTGRTGRKGKRK